MSKKKSEEKHRLYFLHGGTGVMAGVIVGESDRDIWLQYPATVQQNSAKTGWVFVPVPFVPLSSGMAVYRTGLLGHATMPENMVADFEDYIAMMEAQDPTAKK